MGKHALLSAFSSHRWLACPPSVKLCAEVLALRQQLVEGKPQYRAALAGGGFCRQGVSQKENGHGNCHLCREDGILQVTWKTNDGSMHHSGMSHRAISQLVR